MEASLVILKNCNLKMHKSFHSDSMSSAPESVTDWVACSSGQFGILGGDQPPSSPLTPTDGCCMTKCFLHEKATGTLL